VHGRLIVPQLQVPVLLEPISLLRPVNRVAHIRARQRQSKQDKLDKEPRPTSSTLLARHGAGGLAARCIRQLCFRTAGIFPVQVM
jgi:hypothetical protein